MKKLISALEIEAIIRDGGDVNNLPSGAIITPSARDLIRAHRGRSKGSAKAAGTAKSGSTKLTPFS